MFLIAIHTVGSRFGSADDFDEVSWPAFIGAETFQELKTEIRQYQSDNMIGAENWMHPTLHRDENPIGYMSYDYRVWELGTFHPDAKEINVSQLDNGCRL